MPSNKIRSFIRLCEAGQIPIESLAPDYFKKYPSQLSAEVDTQAGAPSADEAVCEFKTHLTSHTLPQWATMGEIPRCSLRPLLEMVDAYFKDKDVTGGRFSEKLKKDLLIWADHETSLEDAKNLYAQKVQVGSTHVYLIEILGSCLENSSTDLDKEMLGIARWLCKFDPSLIGEAKELRELYLELKIGPAFGISELRSFLRGKIRLNNPPRVKEEIKLLQELLCNKEEIDSEVMRAVYEMYRLRFKQILEDESRNTERSLKNYLDDQEGENRIWIDLAKKLCGAGKIELLRQTLKPEGNSEHFKNNFLRLLIPTLTRDTDTLKLNCIADHALGDLLLAQNATYLINLNNSHARVKKGAQTYYNYDAPGGATPYTSEELQRFERRIKVNLRVAAKFKHYLEIAKHDTKIADRPIYKATIDQLINLVNESTFADALQAEELYTPEQMEKAGAAYQNFYFFLKELAKTDKEERARLGSQRIVLGQTETTFDRILLDVDEHTKEGCIPSCNRLFIALILSYKNVQFNSEIEYIISAFDMRKNVETKIFREYEDILDEKEAKRRILILAKSLMTEFFQHPRWGVSVSIGDCSNTMVDETQRIFQLINTLITDTTVSFKNAPRVYVNIMESVVLPTLAAGKVDSNTRAWLESVKDQTLFKKKDAWYQPEQLLTILAPICKTQPAIQKFLDELLRTYAQVDLRVPLKELRINIMFTTLLKGLEPKIRTPLLRNIRSSRGVSEDDFAEAYVKHLVQRLAFKGAEAGVSTWIASLFKPAPFDERKYSTFATALAVTVKNKQVLDVFKELHRKIDNMSKKACTTHEKATMRAYLAELEQPIKNIARSDTVPRVPMSPALPNGTFFSINPLSAVGTSAADKMTPVVATISHLC